MIPRSPDFPISLAGHASPFILELDAIGAPWRSALNRARLPSEISDPLAWLPTQNLMRFVEAMSQREAINDLGVLAARAEHPGAVHPTLLRQVQLAPTLFAALRALCQHSHLQGSHIHFELQRSPNALIITHRGSIPADFSGAEQGEYFRVVRLIRLIRSFLGSNWRPAWISLTTFKPPPRSLDEFLHGCEIRTGLPLGEVPIRLSQIACPSPLAPQAQVSSTAESAPRDLPAKVKAVLTAYLPEGGLSITEMAEVTGMSSRTFQRALADSGSSYSELLDQVRFARACTLLQSEALGIAEIAYLTGYTDPSNFARSFRRICGRSPGEYRNDLLQSS